MTRKRGDETTSDQHARSAAEFSLVLPEDRGLRRQLSTGAVATVSGIALSLLEHEFVAGVLVVLGLVLMVLAIHHLGRSGS